MTTEEMMQRAVDEHDRVMLRDMTAPLPLAFLRADWPVRSFTHPTERLFFVDVDGLRMAIMHNIGDVAAYECTQLLHGSTRTWGFHFGALDFMPRDSVRIVA